MPLKSYSALSWEGLKRHQVVQPVAFCIVLGSVMAAAYTLRLALRCPDVTWRNDPAPWNYYKNRDYKLVKIEPFDTQNYVHPGPKF